MSGTALERERRYWERMTADVRVPVWYRVVAFAYFGHDADGTVTYPPALLAAAVGGIDPETGRILMDDREIGAVVDTLVTSGWLAPNSTPERLIIPGHDRKAQGGRCGRIHRRPREGVGA